VGLRYAQDAVQICVENGEPRGAKEGQGHKIRKTKELHLAKKRSQNCMWGGPLRSKDRQTLTPKYYAFGWQIPLKADSKSNGNPKNEAAK